MSMLVHGDKPEAKKSNKYVEIKKVNNTKYFVPSVLFRHYRLAIFRKSLFLIILSKEIDDRNSS